MTIRVHTRVHAWCFAALLGLVTVGLPAEIFAQGTPRAGSAQADRVHVVRRLGSPSRFTPAVRNVEALKRTFARPRTQPDLTTVLKIAEMSALEGRIEEGHRRRRGA